MTVDLKLSIGGSNLSPGVLVYIGDSSANISSGTKVGLQVDASNSALKKVSLKMPNINGQKYVFVALLDKDEKIVTDKNGSKMVINVGLWITKDIVWPSLFLSSINATSATLSWTIPTGAVAYDLARRTYATGLPNGASVTNSCPRATCMLVRNKNITSTTDSIVSLSGSTPSYFYQVRFINANDQVSNWSNTVTVSRPAGKSFFDFDVDTGGLPVGVAKIRLDAYSEDGRGSLKVQIDSIMSDISTSGSSGVQAVSSNWKTYYFDKPVVGGNVTSISVIQPGICKGKNKIHLDNLCFADSKGNCVGELVTAPYGLIANGDVASVILHWQARSGRVSGFNVYRSTTPNFTPSPSTLVKGGIKLLPVDPNYPDRFYAEYIDSDKKIIPGNIYYYKVTAYDTYAGESLPSEEKSAKIPLPIAIPILKLTSRDGLSVSLEWNQNANATSYQISREMGSLPSDPGTRCFVSCLTYKNVPGSQNSFTDILPFADRTYYYTVTIGVDDRTVSSNQIRIIPQPKITLSSQDISAINK